MKKTILAALVIFITGTALAQKQEPQRIFNYHDVSQFKTLPKESRDTMIAQIRKANREMARKKTFPVNGIETGGKIAQATKNFYAQISNFMIEVLKNPDDAIINRNVRKAERLESALEFELQLFTEEQNYQQQRKRIIDDFNNAKYDDAEDRRDARKEMQEDLKDLDDDYKDTIKDMKEGRRETLKAQAENEREDV